MNSLGVILSGGLGTRLFPITQAVSKQLLPVYNKPMVYYPLTTLLKHGCDQILVITNPEWKAQYERLFVDSQLRFGCDVHVTHQDSPGGLAEALLIANRTIEELSWEKPHFVTLILGDNLFYGPTFQKSHSDHLACLHTYEVRNPQAYGVLSKEGNQIEEKPPHPQTNKAVVGLYEYRYRDLKIVHSLKPSARGELEITDFNNLLLDDRVAVFNHHTEPEVWLDMGTPETLMEASAFVQSVEHRTGSLIGSPEKLSHELAIYILWNSEVYPANSPYTNQLIAKLEAEGFIKNLPRSSHTNDL